MPPTTPPPGAGAAGFAKDLLQPAGLRAPASPPGTRFDLTQLNPATGTNLTGTPKFEAWLAANLPGVGVDNLAARQLYTRDAGLGAGPDDPRNAGAPNRNPLADEGAWVTEFLAPGAGLPYGDDQRVLPESPSGAGLPYGDDGRVLDANTAALDKLPIPIPGSQPPQTDPSVGVPEQAVQQDPATDVGPPSGPAFSVAAAPLPRMSGAGPAGLLGFAQDLLQPE